MKMILAAIALLASQFSVAQVIDPPLPCGRTSSVHWGVVGTQGWAAWQCKPSDRTQRYYSTAYVIISLQAPPVEVANVWATCLKGACDYASGYKARTNNLSDPIFAASYAAAKADTLKRRIATNVATTDPVVPCACDVAHTGSATDVVWKCPVGSETQPDHKWLAARSRCTRAP